jgi:hypothetical protein
MLIARALWTIFVIDPVPSSPTHTTLFENVSRTGFTRVSTVGSPPTKITSPAWSRPCAPQYHM